MVNNEHLASEERPWLKWFPEGVREKTLEPDEKITMCQLVERCLREHGDRYPAINYFGRKIKRSEVLRNIDLWARMFKGMGVGVNDRVITFIPFTPEAVYIVLSLNKIGAWPVMLNLGSSPEALKNGAKGAKFGIVSDALEEQMAHVFRNNPEFEHVILLSVSEEAGFPVKQLMRLKDARKDRKILREAGNYISSAEALKRWGSYEGEIEAPCDPERPAVVTSSGGTSSKGYAKQIMDSNRAVISMMKQSGLVHLPEKYPAGCNVYTGFPPFISTCLLVLMLAPLCYNSTACIEPRLSPEIFYQNVMKLRASVCCAPGRCWVFFFTQIERLIAQGKTPDLSFFTMPIMGGDGVIKADLKWMNGLLRKCGSSVGIVSGYGMSEMFSLLSVDFRFGYASDSDKEPVISVGMPLPGSDVTVFDENGNELGYGQRGEICVRGKTLMLGYYNDREKTEEAVRNGWYHSGDYGSVSEDGQIFIYSRLMDGFSLPDGRRFYPVDAELKLNDDKEVHCSMVNNMAGPGGKPRLAAHIVLYHECNDKEAVIRRLDAALKDVLPEGIRIEGYKIHRHIFKMSGVLKVDRNYYREQLTGYIRPEGDKFVDVSFA